MQEQIEKFTSLRSVLVYGGGREDKSTQHFKIHRSKPEVIVATPGRLIDIIKSFDFQLDAVDYVVLDEGDRMLDMGF